MNQDTTVLIVEDEKVLQDVYKLILTMKGYTVVTANNGIEGMTALRKHKPDLVLLDLFMPIMNGKEFLLNFDKSMYPNTKIIVYSNLSDSQTEQEVLANGAAKVVLKSSMTPNNLIELTEEFTS